jgi:thioredoxin:protein disulfide reductase
MKRKTIAYYGLALIIALSCALVAFGQSDKAVTPRGYLSVDAIRPGDKFKIAMALTVADGYHINAHIPTEDFLVATEVKFDSPKGIRISEEEYPAPKHRKFEFSEDKEYAVHEGVVYITADAEADSSIQLGATTIHARVTVQSCDEKTCLAPATISVDIPAQVAAASQPVKQANGDLFAAAAAQPKLDKSKLESSAALIQYGGGQQSNKIADIIASQGLVVAFLSVFVAGLLLNTTPCVYPIIPITIGFFMNQSASDEGKPRISRTFLMASTYVLGMAITYSLLGVIAAKSGGLFGAALQNPIVLIGLAGLMIALSLSMFGVYEFKLPESLNRLANSSAQSTGGALGAFVMGLTMGIVAAPCIGPFVLALLVFVGEKGDAVFGFFMFFVLALGLGLPYLILGTFSGAIKSLPRSGLWMVTVRKVFGLALIGMALYFLMPLLGNKTKYVFIAFFAVSALYLLFYESGKAKQKQFAWALRAIGIGAAVVAVMMALPKKIEAEIEWHPYSEQAVAEAQREGKSVIIDTFADWCIPCKELDQATFTDANVKHEAERFVRLKLDLTSSDANTEAGRAKEKFRIRGVPTIIFIDPAGRERADLRLEGFEKPNLFLARLKQVETSASAKQLAKNATDDKSPATDATPGSSAPKPLPSTSVELIKGGALQTDTLRGKVALINFWATWCVPCKAEIPMFNQFDRDYKSRGLEILGVSLDEEGADKVKPFLKQNPMSYAVAVGDQKTSSAFQIDDSKLPITLLVDKQGRIRFKHIGLAKKDVFEAEINQLLNE